MALWDNRTCWEFSNCKYGKPRSIHFKIVSGMCGMKQTVLIQPTLTTQVTLWIFLPCWKPFAVWQIEIQSSWLQANCDAVLDFFLETSSTYVFFNLKTTFCMMGRDREWFQQNIYQKIKVSFSKYKAIAKESFFKLDVWKWRSQMLVDWVFSIFGHFEQHQRRFQMYENHYCFFFLW